MKKTSYFYLIFVLNLFSLSNAVFAANNPVTSHTRLSSTQTEKTAKDDDISKSIQAYEISALKTLIDEQKDKIASLQNKLDTIENSSGLNFAVWSGIILTSVAILLTTLGIIIAVFSFFGYKKVMNGAKDAAKNVSKDKATEITERLAPTLTENILLKLLENGNFDEIIQQAVEKVTYRGIEFSSGDMLEEQEKGE